MIRITQGEPLILATTLSQNNTVVGVSGWNIRAAIRRNADSTAALSEGVVTVLTGNVVRSEFANTESLEPGQYVVSLRFEQPEGIRRTINYDLTVRADDSW
jgi:lipopolysaccharide export system protein LptA